MFAPVLAGLVAGTVHVFAGADHLAAVTPLAVSDRRRAGVAGIRWGLGHTAGVAAIAVLAFLFREALPLERISAWSERSVGIVLVGIGLWALRSALRHRVHAHEHAHGETTHTHIHVHPAGADHAAPAAHSHAHAAFGVGTLHGLAGSSHFVAVLPALGFESREASLAYLAGYAVASVAAMGTFAFAVGRISERLGSRAGRAYRVFLTAAALAAIGAGALWIVGWRSAGEAASPVSWEEPAEVATGEARHGPWRMNESDYRWVDDPTVAIAPDGAIAVAWVDQARKDVFFRWFGEDGSPRGAAPVDVSRSPRVFSWLPRIALVDRDVYVLWQEIVFSGGTHGGEILFARSIDGGRSFEDPVNLSNSRAGDGKGRLSRSSWHNGSLDLRCARDGKLHAAWTEYEGALRYRRSDDRGATFSTPLRIAGDGTTPARGPSLAVDGERTVYLAWTVGEDRAADIRVARSDDGGLSFGPPVIVAAGGGHCDAPKIAVDAEGTVHLAYAESPEGRSGIYRIRLTRSGDGAHTFETPRGIRSALRDEFAAEGFPALAIDDGDRLHVLWELFPAVGGRSRGLGYTLSRDSGDSFLPASIVPGSADPPPADNGSRQGLLMQKLAAGPGDRVAVVNSTFRRGRGSRVELFVGRVAD